MKQGLSTLSIALLAAGFGLSASSVSYAQNNRHPVTVPTSQAQYFVAVTGLWARGTNDDLTYAQYVGNAGRSYNKVEHDFDFGWRLDGGFELNQFGNDIAANYTYLSSSDDASTARGMNDQGNLYARFLPSGSQGSWHSVTGESEIKFHEFNVELGQKVDFCQLHTRFHMGLSYAQITHDFDVKSAYRVAEDDDTPFTRERGSAQVDTEFKGIGPRVGLDITYPVSPCNNFAIVGHAAGALLAGTIERDVKANTQRLNRDGSRDGDAVLHNVTTDDSYTIVPAGTLKLGLRYGSTNEPGSCGWAVEGGFQTTGYVHVLENQVGFGGNNSTTPSNYGNYGFYLTFGYAG